MIILNYHYVIFLEWLWYLFLNNKNSTRTTLAIILVGVYALMWAWIIYDVVIIEPICTTNCDDINEAKLGKLGDFVGVISTMTVLVTLVVQFYFRRSNPSDRDEPLVTLKKRFASDEISEEDFIKYKALLKEK